MYSVSFVVDISGSPNENIAIFDDLAHRAQNDHGIIVEYLLYTTHVIADVKPFSKFVQVITSENLGDARNLAIASASSVWLLFTAGVNVLLDTSHIMALAVIKQHAGHFLVPVRHIKVHEKIPVFIVRRFEFFAVSKDFLVEAKCQNSDSLENLVRFAIQKNHLRYIVVPRSKLKNIFTINPVRFNVSPKQAKKTPPKQLNTNKLAFSRDIPIFIICRDRFTPLLSLVKWLEDESMSNIIFINNSSTYPPLVEYFKKTQYKTVNLQLINAGHTVAWTEGIVSIFAHNKPFIVTDPDVIPSNNAHGAINYFIEVLNRHKDYIKVGFGLRIDNLPNHYEQKNNVIRWEGKFWKDERYKDLYNADIDTTFALYRPNSPYLLGPSLRTGGKYLAEHEPWYIDSKKIPPDLKYYRRHADKTIGTWGINKSDLSETYK